MALTLALCSFKVLATLTMKNEILVYLTACCTVKSLTGLILICKCRIVTLETAPQCSTACFLTDQTVMLSGDTYRIFSLVKNLLILV